MTKDHTSLLIDLLAEKVHRLNLEKDEQRKEINRLKRQITEMEKKNREEIH